MDQLAPLLNQIALTARIFFSGALCQLADFDESDRVGHLHLVKAGRVSVRLRGTEVAIVDRPSALFFPRPCCHALVPVDSDGIDLVCASVDLGVRIRSPIAVALPEFLVIPLNDLAAAAVASTLDLLFEEAFGDRSGRQAALDRLAEYFLIQVLRHVIESGALKGGLFAALADARLSGAVNAMHERPAHRWSLEELADAAGMSRARFAVNFRETLGMTPHDYLTDWRMSIAQNLLKQGRPIKTVAGEVGYQSPAALTRVFSKRLGVSPTEWLRQSAL